MTGGGCATYFFDAVVRSSSKVWRVTCEWEGSMMLLTASLHT